jgi:CheY-like chemotaxis protein
MSLRRLYTIGSELDPADGEGAEDGPESPHEVAPRHPLSLSPPRAGTPLTLELSSVLKSPLQGLSVLVVDDAASIRKVMIRTLQSVGSICDSAADGQAAVDQVRGKMESGSATYDLILMDNIMAPMDGIEATKQIRQLGHLGLIFGATGNVMPDDVQVFLEAGVQEVLAKPLSLSDLEAAFQRHSKRGSFSLRPGVPITSRTVSS